MTSADGLRELGEAAGEGGLEQHAPVALDGAELRGTLRQADGAAPSRGAAALAASFLLRFT